MALRGPHQRQLCLRLCVGTLHQRLLMQDRTNTFEESSRIVGVTNQAARGVELARQAWTIGSAGLGLADENRYRDNEVLQLG